MSRTRTRPSARTIAAAALAGLLLASLPVAFGAFRAGEDPSAAGTDGAASGGEGPWSVAIRTEVARMGTGERSPRAEADRLEAIVGAHGWPTVERAGPEAARAALRVALRATHDPAFQEDYRDFLERAYREGGAPGEAVAVLTDRLRRARGEPQLYGTQATVRGGTLVVGRIEDSAGVDERRAELGLPPLGAYLRQLRAAYGIEGR